MAKAVVETDALQGSARAAQVKAKDAAEGDQVPVEY